MDSLKRFYLRRVQAKDDLYPIIPFKSDRVVIGRSPESTFNIPDGLISRKHAVFSRSTTPDKWIVKNLSLNGVFVNSQLVPKEEEKEVTVGDIIQFGRPANFVYRLGMKIIGASRGGSTSQDSKRLKLGDCGSDSQEELTQEHASLEKRLQECDALKARLQEEQDSMQSSIRQQREALEQKYKEDRDVLERKYSAGALAQQFVLEEKEALAQELENQVRALQTQLDKQQHTLEERLKKEEKERHKISQEKEEVLKRLEEEKTKLEKKMQQERKDLQDQLKVTESYQEQLQKQVEEKESLIQAKEAEQLRANEEKQQLKDQLAKEKQALQEELENVRQALEEKNRNYSDLHSELKVKEEEMLDRMMSLESGVQERVYAEVEKSSALARKQLDDLIKDKTELEEKLKQAQEHDKEELSNLQEALSTVEAQKLSLEQELAYSALASDNARKEVVDTVADVLENELQCPICNELFISAMMLGCGHTFCKYCIGQWKKNKKECPNCRGHITSETRSLVIDNFIDKIVPTLSEELQKRRSEIVAERAREIATMEAQAAAKAAESASRGGRRGRGRGRNMRGNNHNQLQHDNGVRPVHPLPNWNVHGFRGRMTNYQPNAVTNQRSHVPNAGYQRSWYQSYNTTYPAQTHINQLRPENPIVYNVQTGQWEYTGSIGNQSNHY